MQQRRPAGLLNGWPFVGVASVAILAAVVAAIAITPDAGEAAARAVRLTARTSVTLFLAAFTAAALFRLWPNAWTRWQRQNRRYLGVSFAVSHGVHLAAIFWMQHVQPVEFAQRVNAITWIGGGLAYVFIAAMTATSFDRTAQMIGPRAWKILHTVGSYYIWLIFANSYIGRALAMPEYIPAAALVVLALGLRIAARVARPRARTTCHCQLIGELLIMSEVSRMRTFVRIALAGLAPAAGRGSVRGLHAAASDVLDSRGRLGRRAGPDRREHRAGRLRRQGARLPELPERRDQPEGGRQGRRLLARSSPRRMQPRTTKRPTSCGDSRPATRRSARSSRARAAAAKRSRPTARRTSHPRPTRSAAAAARRSRLSSRSKRPATRPRFRAAAAGSTTSRETFGRDVARRRRPQRNACIAPCTCATIRTKCSSAKARSLTWAPTAAGRRRRQSQLLVVGTRHVRAGRESCEAGRRRGNLRREVHGARQAAGARHAGELQVRSGEADHDCRLLSASVAGRRRGGTGRSSSSRCPARQRVRPKFAPSRAACIRVWTRPRSRRSATW